MMMTRTTIESSSSPSTPALLVACRLHEASPLTVVAERTEMLEHAQAPHDGP